LAVRVLCDPGRHRYHLPWLEDVRPRLAEIDVAPLTALTPRRGYTPDFLAPPPVAPRGGIAQELERIAATPLDRAAREIDRSLNGAGRLGEPVPDHVAVLLAEPAVALTTLTDLLRRCWEAFVAPYWPRLSDLLDADVAHRTRRMGEAGLSPVVAGLHPRIGWQGDDLHLEAPFDERRRLGGAGLVMVPSAFVWPNVLAVVDPAWQPTLVYPARGIAELWQPAPTERSEPLARLLGATRATLLASLAEPASTTALARRHQLSQATVSEHLGVLERAGLLARRRQGRTVLYRHTVIGAALAVGES
jgi:DNA-binding transcriptional ArsR family regulator